MSETDQQANDSLPTEPRQRAANGVTEPVEHSDRPAGRDAAGGARHGFRRAVSWHDWWIILIVGALAFGASWVVIAYDANSVPARKSERQTARSKARDLETGKAGARDPLAVPPSFPIQPDSPLPDSAKSLRVETRAVITQLVTTFPGNPDALEMKARLQNWLGETEEAIETWKACIKIDSAYVHAYIGIATAAAKKDQHELAVAYARQALEKSPNSFQARAILADSLIQLSQPKEAVEFLEPFMRKDPRSRGYFLLGQAYTELKDFEKAKANFLAAIQLFPDYTQAYYGLARAEARLGEKENADRTMERFRKLESPERQAKKIRGIAVSDLNIMRQNAALLYTDVGRLYYSDARWPYAAELLWLRATDMDAHDTASRQSMAWLCRNQRRPAETIEWLRELAAIESDQASYWVEIGRLSAQLGRGDEAASALRKAIELQPDQPAAYAALTDLLIQQGKVDKATIELARKAVQLAPTARNYAMLATAHSRIGNYETAIEAMRHAVRLAPQNVRYQAVYESLLVKPQSDGPSAE